MGGGGAWGGVREKGKRICRRKEKNKGPAHEQESGSRSR